MSHACHLANKSAIDCVLMSNCKYIQKYMMKTKQKGKVICITFASFTISNIVIKQFAYSHQQNLSLYLAWDSQETRYTKAAGYSGVGKTNNAWQQIKFIGGHNSVIVPQCVIKGDSRKVSTSDLSDPTQHALMRKVTLLLSMFIQPGLIVNT